MDAHIRGDIIKKAFEQSDILAGQRVRELVIKNIEQDGNALDSEHYLSLKEIENPLHAIFGPRVTPLLLSRLQQDIQRIESFAVTLVSAPAVYADSFLVSV